MIVGVVLLIIAGVLILDAVVEHLRVVALRREYEQDRALSHRRLMRELGRHADARPEAG